MTFRLAAAAAIAALTVLPGSANAQAALSEHNVSVEMGLAYAADAQLVPSADQRSR